MRVLWTFYLRHVVAIVITGCLALSTGLVLAGSHQSTPQQGSALSRHATGSTLSKPKAGTQVSPELSPTSTVNPPLTAIQSEIDGQLAQAETSASITDAEQTGIPAPEVSSAYPSIPVADRSDPSAFAIAFATELLDTNYATQSRAALLAWAEYEESPNTLPGVPTAVAGKALVLSLADPNLPGGTPSPTPSATQWASNGQSGVIQSVSGLQAEVAPDWTQVISEGWQPRDPLMTIEIVTGTMTVSTNGQTAPLKSFSLTLSLGSAAYVRAGYGAVAAGDWTLS
jgi:hypothetical protein